MVISEDREAQDKWALYDDHTPEVLNSLAQGSNLYVPCPSGILHTAAPSAMFDTNGRLLSSQTRLVVSPDSRLEGILGVYEDSADSPHHRCIALHPGRTLTAIAERDIDRFESIALVLGTGEVLVNKYHNGGRLSNIAPLIEAAFDETSKSSLDEVSIAGPGKGSKDLHVAPAKPASASLDWRSISYTTLADVQLENEKYKLLIQPIYLPLGLELSINHADAEANTTLLLVGIISSAELAKEARRVPPTAAVSAVTLVLAALLALWPVVKLGKMAPADVMTRWELYWVILSLLATIALVTVMTVMWMVELDYGDIHDRLVDMSKQLESHFVQELISADAEMDLATKSDLFQSDIASVTASTSTPHGKILFDKEPLSTQLFTTYKWIDQIFWTDPTGRQLVKWSVHESPTLMTTIAGQRVFDQFKFEPLWQLRGSVNSAIVVTPFYSWNTGEYVPMILKPYKSAKAAGAVGLTSFFPSVSEPVLPPDIGFAIINTRGEVIFHSDHTRNGRENLFQRLASPAGVRHAIEQRADIAFGSYYSDTPIYAYARPFAGLANCNWTIIVWSELNHREQFMASVFAYSVGGIVLYFAYSGTVIYIAFFRKRTWDEIGGPTRRWGEPKWLPELGGLVGIFAIVWGINWAILKGGGAGMVLAMVASMPPFVIGVGRVAGGTRPHRVPKRWLLLSKIAFVIAVSLGAMLLGSQSVMGVTRLAWDYLRVEYCARMTTDLLTHMEGREKYIRNRWEGIWRHSDVAGSFDTDLLEERRKESHDIYYSTWLAPFPKTNDGLDCTAYQSSGACVVHLLLHGFIAPSVVMQDDQARQWTWQLQSVANMGSHSEVLIIKRSGGLGELVPGVSGPRASTLLPFPFPRFRISAAIWICGILILWVVWRVLFRRYLWGYQLPTEFPLYRGSDDGPKVILTSPWQIKSTVAKSGWQQEHVCIGEVGAQELEDSVGEGPIVITGIEQVLRTEEAAADAVTVLEVALRSGRQVLLLTTIDPTFMLTEPQRLKSRRAKEDMPVELRKRWLCVLTAFDLEQQEFYGGVALTHFQCWQLWNSCTASERLALWQIAEYGTPNPKTKEAIDHLARRGLIDFDGITFRVVTAELSDFAKSDSVHQEILAEFTQDYDDAWRGIRFFMSSISVLAIGLLVWSLADWWESSLLKILSVAGTVLPFVIKAATESASVFGKNQLKNVS